VNWDISVGESTVLEDNSRTTSLGRMSSPEMIGDHEVHSNSQSRDEQDTFASTVDTNDSMDPDSLTAMERSQTPTDDQREASPSLSNPEVGIYEDIGAPIEPKIHELKIAQQFIEHLENATLDNSKIDDWV
jgi:hypothetical protein